MITQLRSKQYPNQRKEENISSDLSAERFELALQFKVFAVLWAIATLFHMAHSSVFDTELNLAALTVTAFFVIFRPSLTSFLALIILQLFDATFRMPFTTNHWIFTVFVNATILQVLIFLVVRNRTFRIKEDELFNAFGPIIRIELIILYFFAVFHKLNSGFFTPATSCATDLLKAQGIDHVIPLSEGLFTVNAYFTLIVECAIPVLLCFRRTVNIGIVIGLFFHFVLSYSTYNAFFDFSSMVFALYCVFMTSGFSKSLYRIVQRIKSFIASLSNHFSFRKLIYIMLALVFSLGVLYLLNKWMNSFQAVHLYFFWTIYSIFFSVVFILYLRSEKKIQEVDPPTFRVAHWSFILMPLFVFANGTLPYLGLKTENSYAMFSNLRTEGGETNHYVVPSNVQIFDYQKDVVEIISFPIPYSFIGLRYLFYRFLLSIFYYLFRDLL